MCKCASFMATKGKIWFSNKSDSHEEIIKEFELHEGAGRINFVRLEVSPENDNLSLPLKDWIFKVDQKELPDWFDVVEYKKLARLELIEWAKVKLNFNVAEAFKPVHPFKVVRTKANTLSQERITELVKDWASVRASVRASVGASVYDSVWDSVWASIGDSVRDSVRDSVYDSVWASVYDSVCDSVLDSVLDSVYGYIGSLFPNIKEWKNLKGKVNPWDSIRELWINGYVPVTSDGKTWKVLSGEKAELVCEVQLGAS